ncbi:uncharacterized protein DSM5745_09281 [Aspergillus mulundensis]|uniref:HNH nuclease domain-containing protein n=1 Tax=Aspergillus mulundensis TaxID=1810919 RepID=A0A3D8R085_9EURO|nr:hypothetical protein DSM5745_09281 [Aspergillus mulundensis]RDW67415.1 hypothetical protein DSM5745_09281 [Aspergillus mulundensis]
MCQAINREKVVSLRQMADEIPAEQEQTDEAKTLFQHVKAWENFVKILEWVEDDNLEAMKRGPKRSAWTSFKKLLRKKSSGSDTQCMERGTMTNKEYRRKQAAFRAELIKVSNAQHPTDEDTFWCPVVGTWFDKELMHAVQLFPDIYIPDVMDRIFDKGRHTELYTPKNGLFVSHVIEKAFDAGKIAIMPNLPNNPSMAAFLAWVCRESLEYKVKIMDPTWEKLDQPVTRRMDKTWRQLDGQRLQFRSSFRPAWRYLDWHFCVQILRSIWACRDIEGEFIRVPKRPRKRYWGVSTRCPGGKGIQSVFDDLSEGCQDLIAKARIRPYCGSTILALEVACRQITTGTELKDPDWRRCENDILGDEDDTDEEDDDEEDSVWEAATEGLAPSHCSHCHEKI